MNDCVINATVPTIPLLAAAPSDPPLGYMYYDTQVGAVFVWDGSTWQQLGGGGAGTTELRLRTLFVTGGSINPFKIRPVLSGEVTYSPYSGSTGVTDNDTALIHSVSGGTYPVRLEYVAGGELTITIRIRSADGTWSTLRTETAAAVGPTKTFEVELGANEAFDLHCAYTAGGTISFTYFKVYY